MHDTKGTPALRIKNETLVG